MKNRTEEKTLLMAPATSLAPKTDIWMPLYIGDYLADTAHLDAECSGCYVHWLMYYWRKGPLPNDIGKLTLIGRLGSPNARNIAQSLLSDFFSLGEDGFWHQKRADAEKQTWNDKRSTANEKGRKAARARWEGNHAPSNAQAMLEHCPTPPPSSTSLPMTSALSEAQGTKTFARSVPPEKLAGTLPLVDGTDYSVSREQVQEWSEAFPAVDVTQELRKFKVWLDANPTRRKTSKGIARAIFGWLTRAQDKPTQNGGLNGNRAQQRTNANRDAARKYFGSRDPERIDLLGRGETSGSE